MKQCRSCLIFSKSTRNRTQTFRHLRTGKPLRFIQPVKLDQYCSDCWSEHQKGHGPYLTVLDQDRISHALRAPLN
jgi:hypothetical protein